MKSIYFTLLLICFTASAVKAIGNSESKPDGPVVTIYVEFGKRPGCAIWWTICSVKFGGVGMSSTIESGPTSSGYAGGGGGGGGASSWILRIPRKNLATYYPQFLSRLEGKSTVTFDDGFVFPSEFSQALGTSKELKFDVNEAYPLRFENDEFVITFPL